MQEPTNIIICIKITFLYISDVIFRINLLVTFSLFTPMPELVPHCINIVHMREYNLIPTFSHQVV